MSRIAGLVTQDKKGTQYIFADAEYKFGYHPGWAEGAWLMRSLSNHRL